MHREVPARFGRERPRGAYLMSASARRSSARCCGDEVKNLASKSAEAAQSTSTLIGRSIQDVKTGTESTDHAITAMQLISQCIQYPESADQPVPRIRNPRKESAKNRFLPGFFHGANGFCPATSRLSSQFPAGIGTHRSGTQWSEQPGIRCCPPW